MSCCLVGAKSLIRPMITSRHIPRNFNDNIIEINRFSSRELHICTIAAIDASWRIYASVNCVISDLILFGTCPLPKSMLIYYWSDAYNQTLVKFALQWRHNERDGVSNHQPHDCLLNLLFKRRSKKISKLRVTGLCAGNSPVTGEFPAQRASNAENVYIWWRHHGIKYNDCHSCICSFNPPCFGTVFNMAEEILRNRAAVETVEMSSAKCLFCLGANVPKTWDMLKRITKCRLQYFSDLVYEWMIADSLSSVTKQLTRDQHCHTGNGLLSDGSKTLPGQKLIVKTRKHPVQFPWKWQNITKTYLKTLNILNSNFQRRNGYSGNALVLIG